MSAEKAKSAIYEVPLLKPLSESKTGLFLKEKRKELLNLLTRKLEEQKPKPESKVAAEETVETAEFLQKENLPVLQGFLPTFRPSEDPSDPMEDQVRLNEAMDKLQLLDIAQLLDVPIPNFILDERQEYERRQHEPVSNTETREYFIRNFQIDPSLYKDDFCRFEDTVVTVQDFMRLYPKNWLNDILINFYIQLMQSKDFEKVAKEFYKEKLDRGTCYYFFTYVCSKIVHFPATFSRYRALKSNVEMPKEEAAAVEKQVANFRVSLKYLWEKRAKDLKQAEVVFIPYHKNDHWLLYIVRSYKQTYTQLFAQVSANPTVLPTLTEPFQIFQLDSLEGMYPAAFLDIREFFNFLFISMLNHELKASFPIESQLLTDTNTQFIKVPVLRQNNSVDCGVCMLENIEQVYLLGNVVLEAKSSEKLDPQQVKVYQWKRQKMIEMILGLRSKSESFEVSL